MAHVRTRSTLLLTFDNMLKTGFSQEMPVFSFYFSLCSSLIVLDASIEYFSQ